MDPNKVEAVREWPKPECLKDVHSFLGFANFYRRFIIGYSVIVSPMTALTREDTPFVWSCVHKRFNGDGSNRAIALTLKRRAPPRLPGRPLPLFHCDALVNT